ncbi:hypothetical protein BH09ACT4_BH09ACT4_01970 [soil metagenome]
MSQTPQGQSPKGQSPEGRSPFSLRNRSLYWWLNVGFAVIIIGLLFGQAGQAWFAVIAVVWLAINVVVTVRARRNSPPPPNLFDDDAPTNSARDDDEGRWR